MSSPDAIQGNKIYGGRKLAITVAVLVGLVPAVLLSATFVFLLRGLTFDHQGAKVLLATLFLAFTVFASLAFAGIGFSLVRDAQQNRSKKAKSYEAFAQRVDGAVEKEYLAYFGLPTAKAVDFSYRGRPVRLDSEKRVSGERTRHCSRLLFAFPPHTALSRLTVHCSSHEDESETSTVEVELDSLLRDGRFVLQTNDRARTQELLDSGVREELSKLREWLEPHHVRFVLGDGYLTLCISRDLIDAGELLVFYGFGTRLYNLVVSHVT